MKLTGADNGSQLSVVVDHLPYLMIYTISVHQFMSQVRAHVCCVNVCCIHFRELLRCSSADGVFELCAVFEGVAHTLADFEIAEMDGIECQ